MTTTNDYLLSLQLMLKKYNPVLVDSKLFFNINDYNLFIWNNSHALLLFENNINKHIVPIMLSCTDYFMFCYIEHNYINNHCLRQLNIFDFI